MKVLQAKEYYQELKTELEICDIGGLFIALHNNKKTPSLIINQLQEEEELKHYFQLPIYIDKKKLPFPILFEQTFEQIGSNSNIYHVLDIEKNLSSADINTFIQYLQYARERLKAKPYSLVFWITPELEKQLSYQAPDFYHWVFAVYDFTNLDSKIISLKYSTHRQLSSELNKIQQYLEKVVWQYENWQQVKDENGTFLLEPMERADLNQYYVQSYCINKEKQEFLLDDLLAEFIDDPQQTFLTLLGDFGTGKSSFSIYYFIQLAQEFLIDNNQRIPIFISLKYYQGTLNIEDFIIEEFYHKFGLNVNYSFFVKLALAGKFIFFIDGFDEMASLSDQQVTFNNLKELTKLSFENILFLAHKHKFAYQVNKVFLTSRTHYFLTETQEQDLLKADHTILYRNYATKTNYQITRIRLKEFNDQQIKEYINKHVKDEKITHQYLQIIQDTYNLQNLSTRPLLLDMIIKTLPTLKQKKNINPADLYQAYTNIWIERDDWRSQLTSEGKRHFMWDIAMEIFQLGGDFSIHYSQLNEPKQEYRKPNLKVIDGDYFQYETTTCSFLNRDEKGNYTFIHKSFMEYFVAEYFSSHFLKNNQRVIDYKLFNQEIKLFFKNIIVIKQKKLSNFNFSYFDLSKIHLNNFSFQNTNLRHADLSHTDLSYANLSHADLSYANLSHADLSYANLSYANLSHTNLSSININQTNLNNAILNCSNLSDALLAQLSTRKKSKKTNSVNSGK